MSDQKQPKDVQELPQDVDEQYILNRYKSQIDYYWGVSGTNKRAYKRYRSWTIFLGGLVTLVSSLSTAEFFQDPPWVRILFAVATPIIAFTLTVMNGMGQNFHWGSTWRDMVINATRLEKERDRFLATASKDRDFVQELENMNSIVLEETRNFFQRVLDSEIRPREQDTSQG